MDAQHVVVVAALIASAAFFFAAVLILSKVVSALCRSIDTFVKTAAASANPTGFLVAEEVGQKETPEDIIAPLGDGVIE